MTHGRTIWWPKDSAWWRRERIVELGEEFGAEGPAVIDWLACEAKAQNDGGFVKTGVKSIARGCFVDPVTVRHVLSRGVTLCVLDDFSEANGVITCRISGWKSDEARGRAAIRQQEKRLRDAESDPSSHALPRPVTERHVECHTEEERRGEKRGTTDVPALRPPHGSSNVVEIERSTTSPTGAAA